MVRIGVVGVAGRMGLALVRAIHAAPTLQLVAAYDHASSPALGQDAGKLAGLDAMGVLANSDLRPAPGSMDVMVDFSRADAVGCTAEACAAAGVALMIGTTGLDAATQLRIDKAAEKIPVLVSANTSLALNVLAEAVRMAARSLPDYDIEIFEAHHRHKVDAPSGTALLLGDAAAEARGQRLERPVSLTGARSGPRGAGGIGFSVARGGDVVGEHDVRFLGTGEQLQLSHVATDRAIFARGALAAARWVVGRPAGRYSMADFLFPKQ
ncbi:MAG: 4-hydroxy-tetrahydrodipicolinate reductase [Pseudomonadota bacterium]